MGAGARRLSTCRVVSGILVIALSGAAALLLLLPVRQGATPEAISRSPGAPSEQASSKPRLRRDERRRTSAEGRSSNRSLSLASVPSRAGSPLQDSAGDEPRASELSEEERGANRSLSILNLPLRAGSPLPDSADDEPRTFKPSKPGACLKFIHIPKTAGTMMENIYAGHKKFLDPRVSGWGKNNVEATCKGGEKTKRCIVNDKTTCNFFHTPPMLDPLLWKTGYEMCDTFCIVRHPVDRFVSEWQYRKSNANKPCQPGQFPEWARLKLRYLEQGSKWIDDCHLLPQMEFVYHSVPGKAAVRMCQHILRYERLAEDFAQLMKAYNYSLPMSQNKQNARPECKLEIPQDILTRLRLVYSSDFGVFGYS